MDCVMDMLQDTVIIMDITITVAIITVDMGTWRRARGIIQMNKGKQWE